MVSFDDLPVKPLWKSPLDKFGFLQKCCWCCSLSVAAGFICLLSFFWALYELLSADKYVATMFPDRDQVFFAFKIFYLLISMCFLLACGGLLFGMIAKRYEPVHVYIWYAFIFNCLILVILIMSTTIQMLVTGDVNRRQLLRTVFGMVWSCIFFYLLMVMNSYKLKLWYYSLGL